MRLTEVAEQIQQHAPPALQALGVALALGAVMLCGGWWQQRRRRFEAQSASSA